MRTTFDWDPVFPLEVFYDVIGGIYDPDVKDEGSVGTFEEARDV